VELRPDDSTEDVQRGVGAHQQVPAVPVELAEHLGTLAGQLGCVEPVPDPPAVAFHLGDRCGSGSPAEDAQVVRLAATARVERGPRQRDAALLAVDLEDVAVEGAPVGVGGEQFGVRELRWRGGGCLVARNGHDVVTPLGYACR
jgi:hypothetical protein